MRAVRGAEPGFGQGVAGPLPRGDPVDGACVRMFVRECACLRGCYCVGVALVCSEHVCV